MKIFGEGKLLPREACMQFAEDNGLLDTMTIGFHKPAQIDDALATHAPLAGETAGATGLAPPNEERRQPGDHQKETCRLRHDRQAAASGRDHVAVAFFPEEIVACIDFATFSSPSAAAAARIGRRARRIAPDGVVGRVHDAIAVVVASGPGALPSMRLPCPDRRP